MEIKRCPFCNGEANIGKVKFSDNCEEVKLNNRNIGYFGQCIQCSATMQCGISYETEEIAAAKWNKRFVTKDKNGEDVFAGDRVKYRPPDIDELCEDEEEILDASVTGGFLVFDIEGTDFVEASKFGDIELIEDNHDL